MANHAGSSGPTREGQKDGQEDGKEEEGDKEGDKKGRRRRAREGEGCRRGWKGCEQGEGGHKKEQEEVGGRSRRWGVKEQEGAGS